ncbi:hypothetical protein [Nocardia sp. NPDC060259]|uniref:hypothetical protein n=1 Tax=Nocardia sp. NPDC060259 TaxID=3347088 RepID=UPI0036620F6C
MPRYELAGRTVAITGSTGGLGAAVGTSLRARGANLALLDLDGDATHRQTAALGGDTVARGRAVDVSGVHFAPVCPSCRSMRVPAGDLVHGSLHPLTRPGPYTASKAGVWALCDSTRLEVRHLEDVVLASGDLCQGFLDRGDPLRDFVALGG